MELDVISLDCCDYLDEMGNVIPENEAPLSLAANSANEAQKESEPVRINIQINILTSEGAASVKQGMFSGDRGTSSNNTNLNLYYIACKWQVHMLQKRLMSTLTRAMNYLFLSSDESLHTKKKGTFND